MDATTAASTIAGPLGDVAGNFNFSKQPSPARFVTLPFTCRRVGWVLIHRRILAETCVDSVGLAQGL